MEGNQLPNVATVRKEVLALRQEGKGYKEIAQIVSLHPVTVGKICREQKAKGDP